MISFGFDSFEFEVGGGLVSTLRFGSEVCVWFLIKYKKIWVLSLEAENLDLIFVFDVLVVWGLKYGFEFNFLALCFVDLVLAGF